MNILDTVNSPKDIKSLSIDELKQLCGEIREFLIEHVSKTGGHLASNLGVVELTVAFHKVFDMPEDKLIFDVGHQSYVHKILTKRKDKFDTLRKLGGLSGFPKKSESEYDCFNTGHASTSISAALGMARARDLKGDNYSVAALFGDGALTGGMMFEAMNDAGHSKTPLILILNDNNMSISKNVGALSKHLRNLRISPSYFKSKHAVEEFLHKFPKAGSRIGNTLRTLKGQVRKIVLPTTLFEEFGFTYIGPIDGHDIESVISCFEYAKDTNKPVLIHALTTKGRGFAPAEKNPIKFHGLGKFDKITGKTPPTKESYSDTFGNLLCKIAHNNKDVVAITGAMPEGTGLSNFQALYPKQFFDVGIAEEHAVTMAAGMASQGLVPVVALYSTFLQRAYDQTLHDVCLQNLHVVFAIDRAGIVGADGETHQGVYDISYLSHMPNMTILSPSSFKMLDEMLDYAINEHKGPVAIRYPRGNDEYISDSNFICSKAIKHRDGNDISIISSGRMVSRAFEVLDMVSCDCEIIELTTLKPLDEETLLKSINKTKNVIVIEDNVQSGGIGERIGTLIAQNEISAKFKSFAFSDSPIVHGTTAELDKLYGLDADSIAKYVNNTQKGYRN